MRTDHISSWAQKFDIPAVVVDGNDVEAVHAAARDAIAQIRRTGRPFFMELQTFRQRGHFEPDDITYVDVVELEQWKRRDPIDALSARLLNARVVTAAGLDRLKERANDEMDVALRFAQTSPWPSAAELTNDVYA